MRWFAAVVVVVAELVAGRSAPDAIAERVLAAFRDLRAEDNKVIDVRAYGAVGDGVQDDLPAFREALRAAATTPLHHGAQHVVRASDDAVFLLRGSLRLPSFTRFEVGRNTTLRFRPGESPRTLTVFEGTTVLGRPPLLGGLLNANTSLVGLDRKTSVVDGGGALWPDAVHWQATQARVRERVRAAGNDTDAVGLGERLDEEEAPPPNFVEFVGGSRVLVSDLTLRNSPFWTLHFYGCDTVLAQRLTLESSTPNADGVDVQSSSDVLVEDVDVDTTDDALVIKAGRDADAWQIGRPTTNVVVRDCAVTSRFNAGLAVGSEVSGGVSHVYFLDNLVRQARFAFVVKSNLDRGGYVQDVFVNKLAALAVSNACLALTHDYHSPRGGDFTTRVSSVDVSDVRCTAAPPADDADEEDVVVKLIDAVGRDAARPLSHLRFADLHFLAVTSDRPDDHVRLRNVADLRVSNVFLAANSGPGFQLLLRHNSSSSDDDDPAVALVPTTDDYPRGGTLLRHRRGGHSSSSSKNHQR